MLRWTTDVAVRRWLHGGRWTCSIAATSVVSSSDTPW